MLHQQPAKRPSAATVQQKAHNLLHSAHPSLSRAPPAVPAGGGSGLAEGGSGLACIGAVAVQAARRGRTAPRSRTTPRSTRPTPRKSLQPSEPPTATVDPCKLNGALSNSSGSNGEAATVDAPDQHAAPPKQLSAATRQPTRRPAAVDNSAVQLSGGNFRLTLPQVQNNVYQQFQATLGGNSGFNAMHRVEHVAPRGMMQAQRDVEKIGLKRGEWRITSKNLKSVQKRQASKGCNNK